MVLVKVMQVRSAPAQVELTVVKEVSGLTGSISKLASILCQSPTSMLVRQNMKDHLAVEAIQLKVVLVVVSFGSQPLELLP